MEGDYREKEVNIFVGILHPSLPSLQSVMMLSGKGHSAFKSWCAARFRRTDRNHKTGPLSLISTSLSDEDALLVKQSDQVNLKK